MPESYHLKAPPIVEALVHFQANASGGWDKGKPKELALALFPGHPVTEELNQLSVELQPGTAEPIRQIVHQTGSGFIMRSSVEPTVHQVRRDGYSFSRLAPYEGWESFIASAKQGWTTYSQGFEPEELHTLALRFINRLDFPVDEFRQDRESFLSIAPRPPEGLNWGFSGFAHHYSLVVPDAPCLVNLNMVRLLEAGVETQTSMLLDVEVLLSKPLSALGMGVDEALSVMRRVKNDVFFHSLTEKALSRYREA